MRLFYKVYFFLIMLFLFILAGAGYLGYHREVALFHSDMKTDALILGRALSGMIGLAWAYSGPEKAIALIHEANAREKNIGIRWVDLGSATTGPFAPVAPAEKIAPVGRGKSVSVVMKNADKGPCRLTYVPVRAGTLRGAIELCEPLTVLSGYTRKTILYHLVTGVLIMLAAGGVLWFHFRKWIHRPLVLFIEKSRRIGQGDLAPDLAVKGHDEFAVLGRTINSMCRDLAASLEAFRVENERRLEAMEQLRHTERLAVLGRLSAGMAHELGTPLNVIAARSKQIRSGELEQAEVVEFSGVIEAQAQRIIKIMHNLLDFARRRKPKRSLQDMEALVNQVLDMLKDAATKAQVVFNVTRQENLPPVWVDALQIQQVMTNLILNGIQAMENGGCLDVALSLKSDPTPENGTDNRTYMAIRIQDEGPGIPSENRDHLFEPFFTTKDVGAGTGLGLSITYGIIQEHGGWIEVENRPVKGACFTVFLPLESSPSPTVSKP